MSTLTEASPEVLTKTDGVGAYGLYLEYLLYNKATGKLVRQERHLIIDRLVCSYSREKSKDAAVWRALQVTSHDAARELLAKTLKRRDESGFGVEMKCPPLLIEMTAADMTAVEQGEAPQGRFSGISHAEAMVGKIDDDTWAPEGGADDEPF